MKVLLTVVLFVTLAWCQRDRATIIAERLWEVLDLDGNGRITLEDLKFLLLAGDANNDGKIDIGEFQDPFELVAGTCRPETVWIFNKLANWTDRAYPTTDPRFIEEGNVEAVYRHADRNNNGFIIRREFMARFVAILRGMDTDGVRCPAK